MIGTRTHAGWEVRLVPRGVGRFAAAAFLAVWLCFWAVGEVVVLVVLAVGTYGLMFDVPFLGRELPSTPGPVLLVGGFLALWWVLWTVGGLAAMRELLRLLWSEDRLAIHSRGITLTRRVGPFRSTREIPRGSLRAVYIRPHRTALMAQDTQRSIKLATLGFLEERVATVALIREAFELPDRDGPVPSDTLPAGWAEVPAPGGATVLAPDPRTRRRQAGVLAIVAAAGWAVAGSLVQDTLRNPSMGGLAAMALAFVGWLTWKAVWLWRGRVEWRLEKGRITQQRRYGDAVTVLAEGRRLELTESKDSDGDRWYELAAVDASGGRRNLMRTIHDPAEPRLLGQWLARRSEIPLEDRIPSPADRARELAAAREALASAGRAGRFLARVLARHTPRANSPAP